MNLNRYDEIRPHLRTGDIVLFSGKGGMSSLIRAFTDSEVSHEGMVIRHRNIDQVELYESTTLSNLTKFKGVQIVSLRDRILTYKGEIWIRRLHGFDFNTKRKQQLNHFIAEHKGKHYEKNMFEMLGSSCRWIYNRPDMSTIFCSELIAALWMTWGILSTGLPANEYTPADFAIRPDSVTYGIGEKEVLLSPTILAPMIKIKG